jgi:protein-tyrosine phosphatase
MNNQNTIKVLFVCMGNICRSPTAHGVFRDLVQQQGLNGVIEIDSAGTHSYHVGSPPDSRSQATALSRGFDLSDLRARQARAADFDQFDYVLAMDRDNHRGLADMCPSGAEHKLHLFMDFAPDLEIDEVPDPYYGGPNGFDRVFDMVDAASRGLLAHIRKEHGV